MATLREITCNSGSDVLAWKDLFFSTTRKKLPSAFADLHSWVSSRSIVYREDIVIGLEAAPLALQGLFEGRNRGKQLVRVSFDPFSSKSNPTI
jgi:hypothetical protein